MVEYTEGFFCQSAHCDLSMLLVDQTPDSWKFLKTSGTCSGPELWHSCSSSSVDPLQWTQPGPSRWRRFLTQKSNYSATVGENGSLLPTWQSQHCCSWETVSYIREINCKRASGVFFFLWKLFESLCRCSAFLESYCWLFSVLKDASCHPCIYFARLQKQRPCSGLVGKFWNKWGRWIPEKE